MQRRAWFARPLQLRVSARRAPKGNCFLLDTHSCQLLLSSDGCGAGCNANCKERLTAFVFDDHFLAKCAESSASGTRSRGGREETSKLLSTPLLTTAQEVRAFDQEHMSGNA